MTIDEEADLKQGLMMPSEKDTYDADTEAGPTESHSDESKAVKCPLFLRMSMVLLLAILSCLWLFSGPKVFADDFGHHEDHPQHRDHHHHEYHHDHENHDVTVHAGDVFMIQWVPDATGEDAKDRTISLYLHCGGKMGTLVVPITDKDVRSDNQAVSANDTGRHYWVLPVNLVESDNYVIKFVPGGCHKKKHSRRPAFYSQTFTVKQRGRRAKRQATESGTPAAAATTSAIASVTVPTSVAAAPTTPTQVIPATTALPPTTEAPPPVATTPPAASSAAPATSPASTPSEASSAAAPTTTAPAAAPTTGESLSPSSSSSSSSSSSGSDTGAGPTSSGTPALTSTTAAPPPAQSSSTSTSFSNVVNTVIITVTSVDHGTTITAIATALQTTEVAVSTAVVAAPSGKKSASKGPIIGGVVGGLLVVGALVGFGIWFCLRKRRQDEQRRYMTPAPDYVHDHAHKPSPPVSPYPDKSPTLPNLVPIPMPPPPRRARPNQPPPGQGAGGLQPPPGAVGAASGGELSDESQMSPISELPADQEPSELYAGPVPEDKLGAATTPPAGGYATHEPAPQYSAYVNGANVGAQSNNPYFPPSANEASYRGVAGPPQAPRYPENPGSYGNGPTGTPYGSYQDRARAAYHDRGASLTSNTSAISGASPVSPNPGNPGGLQHSTSVASHGSGVSGVSGVSWNQRLEAGETASLTSAEGGGKPDAPKYETSARGGGAQ